MSAPPLRVSYDDGDGDARCGGAFHWETDGGTISKGSRGRTTEGFGTDQTRNVSSGLYLILPSSEIFRQASVSAGQ